ncbi:hypothetical protein KJ605_01640 [Patescibacteria group bacterium]|nr:hypothetical protein [Patescibacteria group bacterium]MBU1970458.1 hypothetical protein [Patescibacteria group bacterium]
MLHLISKKTTTAFSDNDRYFLRVLLHSLVLLLTFYALGAVNIKKAYASSCVYLCAVPGTGCEFQPAESNCTNPEFICDRNNSSNFEACLQSGSCGGACVGQTPNVFRCTSSACVIPWTIPQGPDPQKDPIDTAAGYRGACEDLEKQIWTGSPSPMAIICPIARLLNILIFSAGAIFVALIFITAIKFALAQGDPKALMASKQTLTTAVMGFIVVIGAWAILTILKNVLGLRADPIIDPFGALSRNFASLLEKLNITVTP